MTSIQFGWSTRDDNPYGLTDGFFRNDPSAIDPIVFVDAIALGLSRIRLQLSAILIETASGLYDWSLLDAFIEQANKNGLRVTFPIREFGPKGGGTSWATYSSPCDSGGTYYYGREGTFAAFAVALCQRYSGDGGAANQLAKDGSKRPLWIDAIEVGNEDYDVHGAGTAGSGGLGNGSPCRNPMRYVLYARTIVAAMRKPVAQGGGGWTRRIGTWGCWWQEQAHIKDVFNTLVNPPTDATYNPGGDHSDVLALFDYVNFHNYKNPAYGNTVSPYTIDTELSDIRTILNANGHSVMPIWVTEFGADGPVGNVSEAAQSAYFAAHTDGTGAGALAALRDGGAQHCDLFTMDGLRVVLTANNPTYFGDAKSIAANLQAGGHVRFQAFTTMQNFIASNPTWPFGFSGSSGGGGGGGTGGILTGSFAPQGATTVTLTTEGTSDWAHWGLTTGSTFDHKSSGGTQISDSALVGTGSKAQNPAAIPAFTWSDGTPDASASATQTGQKVIPPVGGGGSSTPHVMVVALENHSYNNAAARYIIGNPAFPHINALATSYALCTHFYGVTHQSLPNYLAFASGSDQGWVPDSYNPFTNPLAGSTLVSAMDAAGISWKHYAENLPSPGYLGSWPSGNGDSGSFVAHHCPWLYFKNFRSASAGYQQTHLVALNASPTFTNLVSDLNGGSPPAFVFVQPNNTDNGHNGSTDTPCDNWINAFIPVVQGTTWYANGGIILLWWDESNPDSDIAGIGDKGSNPTWPGGGHAVCIAISAATSGFGNYTANLNHYGMLRGIEKLYGLPPTLGNSAHTTNGDITPLLGTTVGQSTTNNLGNGLSFTAPADTNTRVLNVYVDASQGQGTLNATLSDGSAPDFTDSSLLNKSGASAGVYQLVYAAGTSGQHLTVTQTLSDGTKPGVVTSADTFTRVNQSNLGTSTNDPAGGETYELVLETGSPAWSIFSNQAKVTSANAGDVGVALLGAHTLQDCEAVAIVSLAATTDSGGLVLRASAHAAAYYRASLTGSTLLLAYVTGGVSTVLKSVPAPALKTGSFFWLRFRIAKNSLYARYWPNDGSSEPANWQAFVVDSTLTSAGQYGVRGQIGAAGDAVLFDTYSVADLSAIGDPSYVSLYAADSGTSIATTSGALSGSTSTPAGTIALTTEGTGDWAHWGFGSASGFDHKAGVTQQISNATPVGSGIAIQDAAALLAYTWTDGTPDGAETASTTGMAVQGVGNGWSFTAPADTTSRVLNVYVQATKAQGTITATLSDGSASAYSDTSLNDVGTGAVKLYQFTYNAASASQTLTVQWTMLTDNGTGASTTTYSTDTFTRANNASAWGTASDSESWAQSTVSGAGVPTYSISSNTGHITSTGTNVLLSLLGSQTQANAEGLVRFSLSNLAGDTAALLLRKTGSTTFYRGSVTSGTTLKITKQISGVDTDLVTGSFTYTTSTLYWLRFRVNGSNLFARVWADGATEPATWTLTTTDSSITGAGGWGLRSKLAAGHTITYDSYSVTSIPSGGTPGSIELQAADLGGGDAVSPPPPPVPPPPTALSIVVTAASALATPWLGVGIQQDAYIQG